MEAFNSIRLLLFLAQSYSVCEMIHSNSKQMFFFTLCFSILSESQFTVAVNDFLWTNVRTLLKGKEVNVSINCICLKGHLCFDQEKKNALWYQDTVWLFCHGMTFGHDTSQVRSPWICYKCISANKQKACLHLTRFVLWYVTYINQMNNFMLMNHVHVNKWIGTLKLSSVI